MPFGQPSRTVCVPAAPHGGTVDGNDIEEMRAVVTRDGETGNDMRNLSPLGVLFTENERQQFLETYWAHWSARGERAAMRASPHASRVPRR